MANSDGIDDSELPTKPLPVGEPMAGHVPIAELPTAPVIPPGSALASPAQSTPPARASRPWIWPAVILGVLAAAAIAVLVTGANLGGRASNPAPSVSISSSPATPSASPSAARSGGQPAPSTAPTPPPTQPTPTAAPTPTGPPAPSGTPTP